MEGDTRYAEIIQQRYNKARDLTQEVFDRVELNRNLYKGILIVDDTYEWDYSLVDQQVFPLIRNYIARSNPSMTKIRLEARNPKDFERRKINQDFINWEIGELPLTTLLTRAFFSNYLAGKAYFKTGWKYDPRVVITRGEYQYEMRPLINRADLKFVRFNNILIPNVTQLPSQKKTDDVNKLKQGEKSEFKGLLDSQVAESGQPQVPVQAKGIQLSTHAMRRLQERNISIDKEEYTKLQTAMDRLKLKGGQDSLVITGKAAYIVDVPKNTIVTAIDKDSIGENVFTKIDSTILMN